MDSENIEFELNLGFDGQRRRTKPDLRTVCINKFKDEIAFHEASHFVFIILALNHFATGTFSLIDFLTCCTEKIKVKGHNLVSGFAPANITKDKMQDGTKWNDEPEGYLEFYNEDRRRLAASMLVDIAGYSSYQVFIQNSEYYIFSEPKLDYPQIGSCTINYYDKYNTLKSEAGDFVKIDRRLGIYYWDCLQSGKSKVEAITNFTNAAQSLMKKQSINDSIRFVKKNS